MNPFIIIYASILVYEIILPGTINCVLVAKHVVSTLTCISCCVSEISFVRYLPKLLLLVMINLPQNFYVCVVLWRGIPHVWWMMNPFCQDMCLSLPCFHMFILPM